MSEAIASALTDRRRQLAEIAAAALAQCANTVEPAGHQRWRVVFSTDRAVEGTARITAGWLLLDSPVVTHRNGNPIGVNSAAEQCLADNARLPGGAKYVLLPQETAVRLRSEIPLEAPTRSRENDLAACVTGACAEMAAILSALPGETLQTPGDGGEETLALDLPPLFDEAGWPWYGRGNNRFQVDLEVKNGLFYQASVAQQRDSLRLWVSLVSYEKDALPSSSRLALSPLLLKGGGIVRMVRGAVRQTQQGLAAGFDVRLPGACSAAELAHGLSALSVACELFGREVEAVAEDAVLAEKYLRVCSA